MKFILILGSERSGTNLFQRLICEETGLYGPRPVHILNYFDKLPFTDDISNRVSNEIHSLLNSSFADWQISLTDVQSSFDEAESWPDLFVLLYKKLSLKKEEKGVVIKDNKLELWRDEISKSCEKYGVELEFRAIIRDPLDIVASWLKTPVMYTSIFKPAYIWQRQNGDIYETKIKVERYEDITSVSRTIESSSYQDRGGVHSLWKNTSKDIITNNKGKYQFMRFIDVLAVYKMTRNRRSKYYKNKPWWDVLCIFPVVKMARVMDKLFPNHYTNKFKGDLALEKERVDGGRKAILKAVRLNLTT